MACISFGTLFYLVKDRKLVNRVQDDETMMVEMEKDIGTELSEEQKKDLELKNYINNLKQSDIKEYDRVLPETTQKIVDLINERSDEKRALMTEKEKQAEKERIDEIKKRVDMINAEMEKE